MIQERTGDGVNETHFEQWNNVTNFMPSRTNNGVHCLKLSVNCYSLNVHTSCFQLLVKCRFVPDSVWE